MFTFQYPCMLWALLAAPLALLLATAYRHWRREALGHLAVAPAMLPPQPRGRFWVKNILLAAALALLVLALANPQRGAKKQTQTQQAADVFIALDLSQSMLAADLKPSRLDWAKRFAQKLLRALEGERVGLIYFAGSAYVQVPLSTDYTFLLQSLQSADPTFITAQGTAIPVAIDLAEKSFDEQPGGGRALILISDGEDHDPGAVDRAADAFAEGTVVYTVGVGSPEGAPVPAADGQYKRDESGNVVRTRLEEQALREIALAGGGRAYHVNQDETAIRALRREVGQLQKRDIAIRSFSERESWYAWFVLPALLLLLLRLYLEQRPAAGRAHAGGRMWKGGAAGLLLLFALPGLSAQSAHRSLLSGDQDYRDERYGEAEKHYRNATQADPKNLAAQYNYGNALYKQGKYPEAAEQFGHVAAADPQPGVLHNLGNALLQQRKYREAAQAYERSLRMRPGHPETKMNLQMAKKKLQEEEEKQRQQQQNQQSQQNQNQQNQQNQNQQNQQQQQQQNQKQQQQPQQPQHQPSAPDSPTPQPDNPSGKMNREQARRLLETTVGPNDPKSAQRYRQRQMPPSGSKAKKDW